jgi:hypothetical protein
MLSDPVASAVVTTWLERQPHVQALGIDSVSALDDHTLLVSLRSTQDSAPRLFADPLLSVEHPISGSRVQQRRMVVPGQPPVEFQLSPSSDPRDALDGGIDLLVTRDPAVAAYAAGRSEFASFALPWSRTYLLLQPAGADPVAGVSGVDSVPPSLVRDVVRAEARPAQPPFWWSGTDACPGDAPSVVPSPKLPRIVYSRTDDVARSIAERIVALATGTRLTALGLGNDEFALAFQTQGDVGYVIALPSQVAAPCYRSLAMPRGARIQPLIDTRARAIVRRGTPPLTVDWDGTVEIGRREPRGVPR